MTHYPAHSKIYHIKSDSLDSPKIKRDEQHSIAKKPAATINTTTITVSKIPDHSNPLSGLLGQYDSDSDHEDVNGQESNKLDAKVDNFLQEINLLAGVDSPGQQKCIQKQIDIPSCAWQECFDKSTGFPYYWNVETNAVTWEMPPDYKLWVTQSKTVSNIVTKPIVTPILNIVDNRCQLNVASTIEKQQPVIINAQNNKTRQKPKKDVRKVFKDPNSSDDEKIVMITSFSEGSSSESETEKPTITQKQQVATKTVASPPHPIMVMGPHIEETPVIETKKEIIENVKDENIDETVILARLRTQAKVLHELGGELPKSVDKNILADKLENNKPQSLCLVAGYGDDSDHSDLDDESVFKKSIFPIPENEETTNETKTKESTLFPAIVAIDVKQFEVPNNVKQVVETKEINEELIDNKAFKRKKRLGLAFDVKPDKRPKVEEIDDFQLGETRKGFGFQSTNDNEDKSSSVTFKKGGIAFVKADILNPNSNDSNSEFKINDKSEEDFIEVKNIVTEKVNFLGEGKDPVSAVQIMSIQLQTLEAAYNVQALTKSYLYSWLRETFIELEKLELEAAPEGWTCQWNRSNKRYVYRNTASGATQWHYPEVDAVDLDIVGGGEAMDICTTPPPNDDIQQSEVPTRKGNERVLTPSPPTIQNSPSPPPPPSITAATNSDVDVQPPVPPPPSDEVLPPPPPTISENQPLPPGVDSPDLPYFAAKLKEISDSKEKDSLGIELDSFYSDIAQLEATQGPVPDKFENKSVSSPSSSVGENSSTEIVIKKKKKTKPKIGQGINMKKKAVSSLVEKWKKVQNDY